ncbi:hypothetical protein KUTeg_016678 [Tegillarca granosa]|uniref:Dehydrogenase/reductase SDR family member 11 n=1 Tax=Tegillarca granosa TaxID=220873 RepID=A0ABQ9ES79_TEGGR|nr:hypothetical protein KUTeg_016678 [Tegillarca granosa]
MDRWRNRVALVTGASMGIGESLCKLLVSHGMKVAACARSLEKLSKIESELSSKDSYLPIKCDLRKKEEIMNMFKQIKDKWGGVDVCINNAGLALDSPIIDGDTDQWENMWEVCDIEQLESMWEVHNVFQVNVMALCLCTRESVKSMRERNVDDGHVININSLSGHRVGKMHFYSATKYAVTSLTEGIRWELRGINSHIRVTSISPGLVKTNFAYTLLGKEGAEECYSSRQVSEMMIRPTEQVV